MNEIQICRVKPENSDSIAKVFKKVYNNRYAYPVFFNSSIIKSLVADYNSYDSWYVAKSSDEEILGTGTTVRVTPEMIEIGRIVTDTEYQGNGIASKIVKANHEQAVNNYPIINVECRTIGGVQKIFFEKTGYTPVGVEPKKWILVDPQSVESTIIGQYYNNCPKAEMYYPKQIQKLIDYLENRSTPINPVISESSEIGENQLIGFYEFKDFDKEFRINNTIIKVKIDEKSKHADIAGSINSASDLEEILNKIKTNPETEFIGVSIRADIPNNIIYNSLIKNEFKATGFMMQKRNNKFIPCIRMAYTKKNRVYELKSISECPQVKELLEVLEKINLF